MTPGPSYCGTTCNLGFYPDSSTNQCEQCHSSCEGCNVAGSTSCTSCKTPTYLQSLTGPASCLTTCPNGKYPDSTSNICQTCHSSCLSCSNSGSSSCTTCISGTYLQPFVATCLATCPSTYYPDTSDNKCKQCDSSCLTCSGPTNAHCLSCGNGKYLLGTAPSKCASDCTNGFFYHELSNACQSCDPSCKTCSDSGPNACDTCDSNAFLQATNGPSACDVVCKGGTYPFYADKTCHNCETTCSNCTSGSTSGCKSCPDGLFLLSPPGPSACKSACLTGYYGDNTTNLCIVCNDVCKECISGDDLGCKTCNTGYYLIGLDGSKSNTTGKCILMPTFTPLLNVTSSALSYLLIFPKNYTSIYKQYQQNTTISIDGMSNSSFKYTISYIENTENFKIDLQLTYTITNSVIHVNLNPSLEIISKYDITLTTYTLQTKMKYYYYVDESTQININSTSQATSVINDAISKSFIENNILSVGSSVVFSCLIYIDTIRFLRYMEIKYPENVLSIFQANLPSADMIPNINIDEEAVDGVLPFTFQTYSISIYIFNNNGNTLIEGLIYWVIGIIALKFVTTFRNIEYKYIKIVLILISVIFIWSYALSYFLSNYMAMTFYTLLAYRFPTSTTEKGAWNIFFSVIVGIFVIFAFPFILLKIKKIRPKIFPMIPNLSERAPIENSSREESPPPHDRTLDPKSPGKTFLFEDSAVKSPFNNDLTNEVNPFDPKSQNKKIKTLLDSNTFNRSSIQDKDKLIVENLDSPSISPFNTILPQPKENFKTKVVRNFRRVSKFVSKIKFSISKMAGSKDYPFDWRKSVKTLNNTNNGESFANPKFNKKYSIREEDRLRCIEENRYGTLHKDYKQNNKFQSYFILWILLKQFIYSLIITTTFDTPLNGLILASLLFGLYISSIFIIRPFSEKIEFAQNIFNESCGYIAINLALYMAWMDENEIIDEQLKMNLGWGIVFVNLFLIAVFMLRMMITWTILLFQLMSEIMKYFF